MATIKDIRDAREKFQEKMRSSQLAAEIRLIRDRQLLFTSDATAVEFVKSEHALEMYDALRLACVKYKPELIIQERDSSDEIPRRYSMLELPSPTAAIETARNCKIFLGADLAEGDRAFALVKEATHILLIERFAEIYSGDLVSVLRSIDPLELKCREMMKVGCLLLYDRPDPVFSEEELYRSDFMPPRLDEARKRDLDEFAVFRENLSELEQEVLNLVWAFERKAARLAVRLLVREELQQAGYLCPSLTEDIYNDVLSTLKRDGLSEAVAGILTAVNFDFTPDE